jgi:hypothetical protein
MVFVTVDPALVSVAVTVAPVVPLKPMLGDQLYVSAPDAVSCVDCPEQIACGEALTDTTGKGLTVTII